MLQTIPKWLASFAQVLMRGFCVLPSAIFCTVFHGTPAESATAFRSACVIAHNRSRIGEVKFSMPGSISHIRDKFNNGLPHMGCSITYDIGMSAKAILAENLSVLKDYYGLSTLKFAAKCKVGNGTIGRALLCQSALDIETVETIARACDLEAWQLLAKGLDPRNPHFIHNVSGAEKELYEKMKKVFATD